MPKLVPDLKPGEKFNLLTVQKEVKSDKGAGKWYECLCECGGIKTVNKSDLRNNRVKSCGCQWNLRKDVLGKTFNNLTIDEYSHTDHRRMLFYKYTCGLCGKKDLIASNLIGVQKSCGCYRYNRVENTKYVTGKYFSVIRKGAERRKHEFNIERGYLDDLFEKQNKKCALTGLELNFEVDKNRSGQIASVDRIDSNIGYVVDNVQWVHKDINLMKGPLSENYFILLCKFISNHHFNTNFITKPILLDNSLRSYTGVMGRYFARIRILGERRGLSFNITKEYVDNIYKTQKGKCWFSGLDINFNADVNGNGQTASLDRIDSDLGYEQGNVQWVHKDINIMRNDFTVEKFLRYCRLVAEHNV